MYEMLTHDSRVLELGNCALNKNVMETEWTFVTIAMALKHILVSLNLESLVHKMLKRILNLKLKHVFKT